MENRRPVFRFCRMPIFPVAQVTSIADNCATPSLVFPAIIINAYPEIIPYTSYNTQMLSKNTISLLDHKFMITTSPLTLFSTFASCTQCACPLDCLPLLSATSDFSIERQQLFSFSIDTKNMFIPIPAHHLPLARPCQNSCAFPLPKHFLQFLGQAPHLSIIFSNSARSLVTDPF